VSWSEERFPTASVRARLQVVDGVVEMSDFWASFFEDPRGWASFVRGVAARDSAGRRLSVKAIRGSRWLIGGGYSGPIELTYDVDFEFARQQWPAGNEQVALVSGMSLYTTGLPLFIYSATTARASVVIQVPDDWKVSTSWARAPANGYTATDRDRLLRNALAVGRYHAEEIAAGGMQLRIALLGPMAQSAEVIRQTFRAILDYFVTLFEDRSAGQFLMVVLPGPNDGEAYFDSFASSQPEVPTLANRLVWGGSLAHEFFHYWNGKRIDSDPEWRSERQWFSEGFTEFYANRALHDLGMIDGDTYLEVVSQSISMHLLWASNPYFADVTIKDAGTRKWPNRPGVYDSGFAVGFCLDGIIREQTGGARGLDDLMREMNRRFGRTGTHYRYEDVVEVASFVAGSDLSPFFQRYVTGKTPLPVPACAGRVGLDALVDGYHAYLRAR